MYIGRKCSKSEEDSKWHTMTTRAPIGANNALALSCFVAAFSSCKVHCEAFTASPHNTPNIHSRYLYCQIIIFRAERSPRLFSDEHSKEITAQAPTTEFWKRSNKQRGLGLDWSETVQFVWEMSNKSERALIWTNSIAILSHRSLSFIF